MASTCNNHLRSMLHFNLALVSARPRPRPGSRSLLLPPLHLLLVFQARPRAPPPAARPQPQHLSFFLDHRRCSEGVSNNDTSITTVTKSCAHDRKTTMHNKNVSPCQRSPITSLAPSLLLLFCSPLVLHLLLRLTDQTYHSGLM